MTRLYRAAEPGEVAVYPGSCWSEDRETALAYTEEGVGHGGAHVRSIDVDLDAMLDIAQGPGVRAGSNESFLELAAALGYEQVAEEWELRSEAERAALGWAESGWLYPWEESREVKERLEESGYDWLRYDDDYPEGAVTVMRISKMTRNPRAPRNLRERCAAERRAMMEQLRQEEREERRKPLEFDTIETRGVLGGAYRGKAIEERAALTHMVYVKEGVDVRSGCRAPLYHMGDSYSAMKEEDLHSPPSCPTCFKKWQRLKEQGF